ncbi:srfA-induced gene J protein-like [Schistocerca gregaria]|uniref:srfA-induced gene J protein-like n=1 Tax=Schistocerca gregaria TaxID=7010 RepID=UPI00211EDDD8|nr:srfA-induced gene J protein-like [Schistocerca gregaria]
MRNKRTHRERKQKCLHYHNGGLECNVGEIQVKFKEVWRGKAKERINKERLKEVVKASNLENKFIEKWERGSVDESVNDKWITVREGLMHSAKEVLGIRVSQCTRKEWITVNMLKKMEDQRKWKNVETEEGKKRYGKLNNVLRRETEEAREKWMKQKCNKMEKMENEGSSDIVDKHKRNRNNMEIEEWMVNEIQSEIKFEEEQDVLEDGKESTILEAEAEKALKEMKNTKDNLFKHDYETRNKYQCKLPTHRQKLLEKTPYYMSVRLGNKVYDKFTSIMNHKN